MKAAFASRSVVGTVAMPSNDIAENHSDNEMDVDEAGKDIFSLGLMVVSFIHDIYYTSYNFWYRQDGVIGVVISADLVSTPV